MRDRVTKRKIFGSSFPDWERKVGAGAVESGVHSTSLSPYSRPHIPIFQQCRLVHRVPPGLGLRASLLYLDGGVRDRAHAFGSSVVSMASGIHSSFTAAAIRASLVGKL